MLIGNLRMKAVVAKTLKLFPDELAEFITKNCWIVSSFEDGWAFTLRGDELKKNEYLIFLSDELLQENEKQIMWTLTHEIGHVIMGHRNSIGKAQTKSEIAKQEREADAFARNFLK